ncbi:Glu/Leu/Phe/Val dehydrogenase dimerization domain-containing protein [Nocardioides jiangxiensis]|uniref:Glu/Leu/Phe/Val dehydrogenase dimerization domain-containing protein n=1 Tax=Nocardioides jiangxiensis TaxID=3064524 RepID=A0ABT9B183_9ACTN|nr:Glu/Leu/Phe/Val dehydrogenase dimerization domain-containing protein [Nocardioides sp. WY-20]MDO7868599.1 Glu/Leu/Phe/Val dehydrogenase dimerization domain-containing protein [Nocardioides sp. WY-20]
MKDLLARFEHTPPEVVFEWHDPETEARGWIVINSLRGGAAGGGTRMRAGLNRREVESLAKTMEVKFTVAGPPIGGAKSGIDFDPSDPRKEGVLRRWFAAAAPLLKAYYGTGGDLNVDEALEVVPMTESNGLWHPQEGIVTGHFHAEGFERIQRVGHLRAGVAKPVADPAYALAGGAHGVPTVADLVTGWGVAEAVRHHYELYGGDLAGKPTIVQGWGTVGATAATYLSRMGARIVGIIDRSGGLVDPDGLSPERVAELYATRRGNQLVAPDLLPFAEVDARIWSMGAAIFLPCAASRLVTRGQVDAMVSAGLEVVSCGANVPFADEEIFYGPTYEFADRHVAVIPDFIANCGMARTFAMLMDGTTEVSDRAIFEDVSITIRTALAACHDRSPAPTGIASTALEIALEQLVARPDVPLTQTA